MLPINRFNVVTHSLISYRRSRFNLCVIDELALVDHVFRSDLVLQRGYIDLKQFSQSIYRDKQQAVNFNILLSSFYQIESFELVREQQVQNFSRVGIN